jgi:hypothetical protein
MINLFLQKFFVGTSGNFNKGSSTKPPVVIRLGINDAFGFINDLFWV